MLARIFIHVALAVVAWVLERRMLQNGCSCHRTAHARVSPGSGMRNVSSEKSRMPTSSSDGARSLRDKPLVGGHMQHVLRQVSQISGYQELSTGHIGLTPAEINALPASIAAAAHMFNVSRLVFALHSPVAVHCGGS
eukprot:4312738-Amphidinium_carterae.1